VLVTDLNAQTRNQYNATGDTFFSDAEIYQYYYEGCLQYARECLLIEGTDTSITTVSGTQTYSVPSLTIFIKRVTYNGQKLKAIDFREDDVLTVLNQGTTATGTPIYVALFNSLLYLRPTPDAAQTLKIFRYKEPAAITSASTLEIPTQFHPTLNNYALSCMYAKDKDFNASAFYITLWEKDKHEAKKWAKKKQRGDSFAVVKAEDHLAETILGFV
jgi:hypothetical protein